MTKTLSILAIAATVALAAAAPTKAYANDEAIIGGIIGGLAIGAIVGSAAAEEERRSQEMSRAYQAQQRGRVCTEQQEVWSDRAQRYVLRNVRVRCY